MATDVRTHPELAALEGQARVLDELLDDLEVTDWERDTRCPPLTVAELVAHVIRGLRWLKITGDEVKGDRTTDRVTWWRYDPDEVGERVVQGAIESARGRAPEELVSAWREGRDAALEALRAAPPGRVVGSGDGPRILVSDLAATRVLELAVHTMDIGHATLRGERVDPKAAEIVADICDGLLDAPLPKAIGWDRRTYILTATGRRPLVANERYVLGELADRFPLIR